MEQASGNFGTTSVARTAAGARTCARRLAQRYAALTLAQIGEQSRTAMKRLLMDYLGVALAGSRSESGQIARRFALEGKALLKQYDDRNIRSARVKRLSQLTSASEDATLPRGVSCKMTVKLCGGELLTSQVDYPKASIQNPMTDQEMRAKFESLAGPVIGTRRAGALADAVMELEKVSDVSALLKMTAVR